MTDSNPNLAEIVQHVDEIQEELKHLTERLGHLQVELEQSRSIIKTWSTPKGFQDRPHFGQLA